MPDEPHHSAYYSTSIETFQAQIRLLHELFQIVPLDDLVSASEQNQNLAAIVFDDGFASVRQNADPILSTLKIPYTVFLNGAAVSDDQNWIVNCILNRDNTHYTHNLARLASVQLRSNEDIVSAIVERGAFSQQFIQNYASPHIQKHFLNSEDVKFLSQKGVTFGNHSFDHPVFASTPESEVNQQIQSNKALLQSLGGTDSAHFAIPFGKKAHYTQASIHAIRNAGYRFIYTTNPNCFRAEDLGDQHFLFPRIGLTSETPNQLLFYINRALLKKYNL